MASSSQRGHVEDTYELQNDDRLDSLHSKLRTLRGVSRLVLSIVPEEGSITSYI